MFPQKFVVISANIEAIYLFSLFIISFRRVVRQIVQVRVGRKQYWMDWEGVSAGRRTKIVLDGVGRS